MKPKKHALRIIIRAARSVSGEAAVARRGIERGKGGASSCAGVEFIVRLPSSACRHLLPRGGGRAYGSNSMQETFSRSAGEGAGRRMRASSARLPVVAHTTA